MSENETDEPVAGGHGAGEHGPGPGEEPEAAPAEARRDFLQQIVRRNG